jgi:lipoate---protein ligase
MTPRPTPPLRILDTGLRPARWNVAMTAALAELHAGRAACEAVRFHRYPACVLIGASQDMSGAADVDFCVRAGVTIARRVTGGGAVYMSPGILAWDVLVDRTARGGNLEGVTQCVCDGVAAGLSRLGADARYRVPSDIEIGGRKVSGCSGYVAGRSAVLQGTVLVADEVAAMALALRFSEHALHGRVTCLEAETGAALPMQAVVDNITIGLADALGCEPVRAEAQPDELALCEALLRDEIGTEAYVAGRSAVPV